MEWKYKMIFLSLLLCLVFSKEMQAQKCLSFRYDNKGNRVEMLVGNCGAEYKDLDRNANREEMSVEEDNNDAIAVYPNPNKGTFVMEMVSNDCDEQSAIYQIFDNKGVLIKTDRLLDYQVIDISNIPAGVYLLRIVSDGATYAKQLIKL